MNARYYKNELAPDNLGSLPGADDVTRAELPNGIVVLARSNFNSLSAVVSGYLHAGGLFESDELLGLAGYTASALMRGTIQHSFAEIYESLESIGASLGYNGGTHTTGFGGRALAEDLELLLGTLAETLRSPAFPEEQMGRLKNQLLTGLAIRAQDTREMASLAFDQIVYRGHPYGRPEDGYPETVQRITPEHLADFHQRHYGPRGMVITIVGAVDPQLAVEKVSRVLGDWENPDQPEPPELPATAELESLAESKVDLPGKSQADIVLGAAGPQRRSPDYLAAALGNNILGRFGMMGRIGDSVREKAGLAYYASSHLGGGMGPGPWYVSAGVAPANVEQAINLIRQEIARFVEEPVTEEELSDSQANFIGMLPLSLESNHGVAAALLNLERYQLGLDYYRDYPDLIRAVTRDEILETARRYLHPERLGIAVAGPP